MDAEIAEADASRHKKDHDVAVAVITPVGTYPDEEDFRRVHESTVVETVLKEAALHLKITNTTDWVAHVDGRRIEVHRTFAENDLCGAVEIEWHKHEGGGGA